MEIPLIEEDDFFFAFDKHDILDEFVFACPFDMYDNHSFMNKGGLSGWWLGCLFMRKYLVFFICYLAIYSYGFKRHIYAQFFYEITFGQMLWGYCILHVVWSHPCCSYDKYFEVCWWKGTIMVVTTRFLCNVLYTVGFFFESMNMYTFYLHVDMHEFA